MTLRIHELGFSQCRFPLSDGKPHFFCGEPIERGSYCAAHAKRCYSGKKVRAWEDLAMMIYAAEQTIVGVRDRRYKGPTELHRISWE